MVCAMPDELKRAKQNFTHRGDSLLNIRRLIMTRSLFIENVNLGGVDCAVLLARACGVGDAVINLWLLTK